MLLGKTKIYDIAKELDLTSKEVIKIAQKLKIEAKSHLSAIDDEDAKKIKESARDKKTKKETSEKQEKKGDKPETPVIIRREVIINDEMNNKKEQTKKGEKKSNNIGFVERKQNNDYNIVYRNKPSKPMTVDELFGIKKESKKEEKVMQKVEEKVEIKEDKMDVEVKKDKMEESKVVGAKAENNYRTTNNNNQNNREYRPNNNRNNNNRNNNQYNSNQNNGQHNNQRNNNQNNNFANRNRFNKDKNNNNNNPRYGNRNNQNNDNNRNNRFDNRNKQNGNQRFGGNRTLDEKGIEKNIKNIMSVETIEKEPAREYNKTMDKQKDNNRFDENRNNKKNNKSRKNNQNGEINEHKLKGLKRTDSLSNMFDEQDGGMLDYYDLTTQRGKKGKKKTGKNDENRNKQKIFKLEEITIPENITVKDFAAELKKTTAEIIKKLLGYGVMTTINNEIDFDTASLIADEFGVKVKKKETVTEEDILFDDSEDREEELKVRPPVVVVMGHVDHGKTSLLDAVKKTNVIEGEAGGITQHIGAYKVKINDREITFLDTPGHEAFTAMRARGAQITDIAILVVAANDGVMPQTIEAINHAKLAEIPIIVAVNKIDLPDANIEKVKQELMTYELVPEEWGGDTIYVPISAKQHLNIDQLLEMVLLQADILELKANPKKQAKGVVIEARLDKSKGTIASMLVQRGTLDIGDTIVVGSSIGRIRSMIDDKGKKVKKAGPSTPVEIMGLTEVPQAGDIFYEVKDEKTAKHLIERRKRQEREKAINANTKVTLDNLFSQMEEGNLKTLNLIVKADVQGSVEAIKQAMQKLSNDEVKVKVIHSATGAVTETDVTLAKVSKAIIIAFNVRPIATAKDMAEKEEVEIKQYSIIYQALEDVESAMKGMLAPKYEEHIIGSAEVRQTFKVSNVGTIAGAYVLDGKLERNAGVRIIRDNVVIHTGKLSSLKRFKDDAKEVTKGYECGIQIEKYNDIKEGDIIEAYILEEIKR
ncbi:MAG: translation initiation factor IF-2 [Clostridia bacterium]|nr:translation initiation factor IF-2 [Clostridia bacterium]